MANKIVRKVFINSTNKQPVITLSRKELKKTYPNLKFGKNLFVRLEVFNKIEDK